MTLIPVHVLAGATAIVSGLIALYALKGLRLHRRSGTVFVLVMLVMSLSGVVIAVGRFGAAMNITAGLVTAYLVITGFLTVQPPTERSRQVERGAMFAAFALSFLTLVAAAVSAARGEPGFVIPILLFGLVAVLGGAGDRRMLGAGGLRGSARLRRHLWRMCLALFIAAASFFLGPVRRIPEPLRVPALRLLPFVVLVTMVYWLWRYRRRRVLPDAGETSTQAI
jgi:uncharacterized membrane protein